jgi:hypothetical protein
MFIQENGPQQPGPLLFMIREPPRRQLTILAQDNSGYIVELDSNCTIAEIPSDFC